MTQEDKKLLLQDLCARLPYGVIIQVKDWTDLDAELKLGHINRLQINDVELKPYLFPLSSMTEEQGKEYNILRNFVPTYHHEIGDIVEDAYDNWRSIDYLNAHHFDYRGLIEKGLAIDATNLNIY